MQVTEYQEKLRRKQDSFVQIQREKELQYQELTIKLEEQRVDKDQEIVSLKEQSQRLQGQLNFGHTAYAEFKEKKNAEVQKLEGHIKELENQVLTYAAAGVAICKITKRKFLRFCHWISCSSVRTLQTSKE